jgi:2-polyprenyl-3-methyl-5-hydroxy-6-metoxy-1,4-benzoquinol methylase
MAELGRYVQEVSPFRLPILERVRHGGRVLDVGAWTGAHGSWLVAERDAVVDGVELDPDAAAAVEGYRQLTVGSIEDEAVRASLPRDEYDAVLFLDVLEHLVDPAAVLAAALEWLRPGGVVLCSIPNVAHWRVRLALLGGRWDYQDSGLLDRTHLRWFTRATARALVADCGYDITWEDATVPVPHRAIPRRLFPPRLFAYQLLFEGSPRSHRSG